MPGAPKRGVALPDNVGFIVDLPNRRSFSPDVAFWTGGPLTPKFIEGAPIFAVEVRSEEDYGPAAERAMAAKRADYFAAGTLVVWDVDTLEAEVVRVYRSDRPATATTYGRAERAEAEPALPGWSMPVADLFPDDVTRVCCGCAPVTIADAAVVVAAEEERERSRIHPRRTASPLDRSLRTSDGTGGESSFSPSCS